MWAEALTVLGTTLVIIGLIFGYVMSRMGRIESEMMSKELCIQKTETFSRDMKRIEISFTKIEEKLEHQSAMLLQILANWKGDDDRRKREVEV